MGFSVPAVQIGLLKSLMSWLAIVMHNMAAVTETGSTAVVGRACLIELGPNFAKHQHYGQGSRAPRAHWPEAITTTEHSCDTPLGTNPSLSSLLPLSLLVWKLLRELNASSTTNAVGAPHTLLNTYSDPRHPYCAALRAPLFLRKDLFVNYTHGVEQSLVNRIMVISNEAVWRRGVTSPSLASHFGRGGYGPEEEEKAGMHQQYGLGHLGRIDQQPQPKRFHSFRKVTQVEGCASWEATQDVRVVFFCT
ncbi:hypothetical protein B0H34DRAFT_676198 [Crassisporium funariophilum]|nr:hypothetical protein B0H34DRAFT_676198 [Crassisporium funariophilum]